MRTVYLASPIDRLMTSGSTKHPIEGDTLTWQHYDLIKGKWENKQTEIFKTDACEIMLAQLNTIHNKTLEVMYDSHK